MFKLIIEFRGAQGYQVSRMVPAMPSVGQAIFLLDEEGVMEEYRVLAVRWTDTGSTLIPLVEVE